MNNKQSALAKYASALCLYLQAAKRAKNKKLKKYTKRC
jgi:hypothetical protein